MITSAHLTSTDEEIVYTSSGTNAITTMIICNIGNPDLTDETIDSATITINVTSSTVPNNTSNAANTIIKNLIIPAGETVFLSEERIVLDNGNQIRATASVGGLLSMTVSTLPV
jgi:hypothetical protein